MLHPGDAIPTRRRILYIILLGALTALGVVELAGAIAYASTLSYPVVADKLPPMIAAALG